jgi:hypothetical protein
MNTESIIQIINATAGATTDLIGQLAWFFSIGAAAKWLSCSLPLLILFGILMKIASTLKAEGKPTETIGKIIFTAWLLFAGTLYTSVRGVAHIIQASVAPIVYVATEVGSVADIIKSMRK